MNIKNFESVGLVLTIFAFSCASKSDSQTHAASVKFDQYYLKGEALYTNHCSNCHQANGTGLGLVYPPLNKSDYMEHNFEKVICLIKHGLKEEIVVNGKSYIQPMPGVQALSNLEIAEIATYIYNTWEHKRGIVEVSEVDKVMSNCATVN